MEQINAFLWYLPNLTSTTILSNLGWIVQYLRQLSSWTADFLAYKVYRNSLSLYINVKKKPPNSNTFTQNQTPRNMSFPIMRERAHYKVKNIPNFFYFPAYI